MKQLFLIFVILLCSCQSETKSSNHEEQKSPDKEQSTELKNQLPSTEQPIKPKVDSATSSSKTAAEEKSNEKSNEFLCKVRITVKERDPFCGGVETSYEQRNRYVLVSDKFVIINKKTQEKMYVSSINGIIDLDLKAAKYQLFEAFKDVSKHKFFEEQSSKFDNKLYSIQGSDCFEKWQKTPLLTFELKSNKKYTLLEAKIEKYCFVDANPCIKYNGPLPQ